MNFAPQPRMRQFFATVPVPCPYLSSHREQKLVVELGDGDAELYAELSRAGFRRSHRLAYRPACRECAACVPVRIDCGAFAPTRSLRRVARQNRDLHTCIRPPVATPEHYELFSRYLRSRHGTSDMAGMTYRDYRAMVEDTPVDTRLVEFRDAGGALVGACLTDWMIDGLSAVYSFFEPGQPKRSLGTYIILWLIDAARMQGLASVYLGYWIESSDTMDYKRRFPALEGFVGSRWQTLQLPAG